MDDYENLKIKISIDKLITAIDKLSDKVDKVIEEEENKNKYCLTIPTIKAKVKAARVKMR